VLERRFPTVLAACRAAGIDPGVTPVPVAPAAHYASGGIWTDLDGRTSFAGLYAAGETACTGVHGANRLASNSLLEGLVYGARIGMALGRGLPRRRDPGTDPYPGAVLPAASRDDVVAAIGAGAGIRRTAGGLAAAADRLGALAGSTGGGSGGPADWEATNLLTVGSALVAAAARRTETRGCHWRADAPTTSAAWRGRIVQRLDGSGRLLAEFRRTAEAAA